ncbi:MAG: LptF/LptG family permease [Phycisphaerae bacterium]
MLWTLQRYIFRELAKTFLLAVVGLTAVLGLGGGVLNMVKLGEVTPGQLVRLTGLVVPLAAALTLPVAALFAATSTYGRLAADNELVACRGGGINLHHLFLPTLVISLLAGGVSFGMTNYLIPGMVRNLNEFVGTDVGALIRQQLGNPRGIRLDEYRISADASRVDPDHPNRVILDGVAFVQVDEEAWVRYGTAREVDLTFTKEPGAMRVAGRMVGLSYYDRRMDSFFEEGQQLIPSNRFESPVPRRIKFLRLPELLHYWRRPTAWDEVRGKMDRLRQAVGSRIVHEDLLADYQDDKRVILGGAGREIVVEADSAAVFPDKSLELHGVRIDEHGPDRRRHITAERAILKMTGGRTLAACGVRIELYDVRLTSGRTTIERSKTTLGPVSVDPQLLVRVEAISDESLLMGRGVPWDDRLEARRVEAVRERDITLRRIVGTVSERMAFSVSVLVLVILGAALGIRFRGSHMMTAFGISFVPGLVVIVAIVAGKQLSYNQTSHAAGLAVMWSGIMAVAALDVWTLTRVIRR